MLTEIIGRVSSWILMLLNLLLGFFERFMSL